MATIKELLANGGHRKGPRKSNIAIADFKPTRILPSGEPPTLEDPPDLARIRAILAQAQEVEQKIEGYEEALGKRVPEYLSIRWEILAEIGEKGGMTKEALQPELEKVERLIDRVLQAPAPYRVPGCVAFALALSSAQSEEELGWGVRRLQKAGFFSEATRGNRDALRGANFSVLLSLEYSGNKKAGKALSQLRRVQGLFLQQLLEENDQRAAELRKQAGPNPIAAVNIERWRINPGQGWIDIPDQPGKRGGLILFHLEEGRIHPKGVAGRHPHFEGRVRQMVNQGIFLEVGEIRAEKITRQFPARDLFFLVLDLQKMVRAGIDHAKKLELRRRG
ncbi:MAG: hypothetical protein COV31_00345 [Candidatus Yanofskybacteria bacterium CG10_big_fil_rev_8_21_14_0_10_46_23]|uniref:Uncharacterized protein n=1 Tax=Candidatus Yanofskybacteria bacterium CG10_big_fil_rev_8_21_14_0_10_46_23 TaxID=1975098 RepID=A0A2H0R6T9_9BACT|nr:MAG: hypothetical protein COV31_00345 [Candidatus Yanofskybacteria bacterium CG10_big_fil_rev_8_21_14_0_10_46_23]